MLLVRFSFSARQLAPEGSPEADAVRRSVSNLSDGPSPEDGRYLLPPCQWVSHRRVPDTDLALVFAVWPASSTIHVLAVVVLDSVNG